MRKATIIIPVKDEEAGLKFLLEDYESSTIIHNTEVEFIFVIDGRTSDNSREIARKFSHVVIDQQETHGKGAAVQQAIESWKKNISQYAILLDADGSYDFQSVELVIDELDKGTDVVSGSRFLGSNGRPMGMSIMHYFGNRVLSKVSSIRNGRRISDLCTGLWGFNSHSLENLNISSNGFDLEAEIAGLSRKHNLRHREISVDWSQRKGGTSKLRSIRDGSKILLRILLT